uniref:Uncharacterized protein n=1 Tax=Astyanax mexicanus TaxID=7994 RepID=A0A3B1K4U3_ASTMX
MGVYVITKDGGALGGHDDIGIVVDGDNILDNMKSFALNLAYPKELKYYHHCICTESCENNINSLHVLLFFYYFLIKCKRK